jgi:endoglucanase
MKELIKKLVEVSSPSGNENKVQKVILDELDGHIDGHRFDAIGNLIVWKNGTSENPKKYLLDGHADEIGLVITNIDDNGFLRVDPVGGVNPLMLLGTVMQFESRSTGETIRGICSFESETFADAANNQKNPTFDNLFVDIGAASKAEALKDVRIGQFGTYESQYIEQNGKIISKAMDDRIACAIVVQILKELDTCENTVYGVFSVQEEVGIVGASVAGYDIMPDMAIAIDVTAYSDTPKGFKRMDLCLGKGPAIKIKDKASISDKCVVDHLSKTAQENDIPHQYEVLIFGGTNAHGYQLTRSGIPSGTLSVVTRYVHSPHEMVDYNDVLNSVKLLKKAVEN